MNHPNPEQWADYLYREVNLATRSQLNAHLAQCESCRRQLQDWQSVQQRLDSWKRPAAVRSQRNITDFPRLLRWAAAALIALSLGFAIGRSSSATPETLEALKQELRNEWSAALEAEIQNAQASTLAAAQADSLSALRDFALLYQTERAADHEAFSAAIARVVQARTADYLTLRKDLETVALNSDAGLRQTQQQLFQLADYNQAIQSVP